MFWTSTVVMKISPSVQHLDNLYVCSMSTAEMDADGVLHFGMYGIRMTSALLQFLFFARYMFAVSTCRRQMCPECLNVNQVVDTRT